MNPLSDIGMPDWFWDKFRAMCTHDEHPTERCGCGSGLPLSNCRIPMMTRSGIVYTEHWYGFFDHCLACQTRLLWNAASRAGTMNPPVLVEPSNAERSAWPECTRKYVERLESFYDANTGRQARRDKENG